MQHTCSKREEEGVKGRLNNVKKIALLAEDGFSYSLSQLAQLNRILISKAIKEYISDTKATRPTFTFVAVFRQTLKGNLHNVFLLILYGDKQIQTFYSKQQT